MFVALILGQIVFAAVELSVALADRSKEVTQVYIGLGIALVEVLALWVVSDLKRARLFGETLLEGLALLLGKGIESPIVGRFLEREAARTGVASLPGEEARTLGNAMAGRLNVGLRPGTSRASGRHLPVPARGNPALRDLWMTVMAKAGWLLGISSTPEIRRHQKNRKL